MATQVWNGRKEDWRGCPAPLALVEGAWPLRVEFAKDRVDNHYLVAGRLADLPARAVVIADDDVDLGNRAQSVSLLLKAWRASDDRIVGPSSSARGFAQPAHDAKGHLVNAMRNPSNPVGHVFCALLPQLVVVPVKYLRLYADHKNVVDFVGAHQICDDFALAAVSGVAARAQARNATALAIADVGVGHRMGRGSLSAVPGHYERRAACARGIATECAVTTLGSKTPSSSRLLRIAAGRPSRVATGPFYHGVRRRSAAGRFLRVEPNFV